MLSPYQQILKKQQTDAERDAFLLKKTLELISMHEKILEKLSEIKTIKSVPSMIPGPRGFKGEPGKSYSRGEVVEMLLPYIPRDLEGKRPTKEELTQIITPLLPKVDIEHIAKIAAAIVKTKLPKPKENDFLEILKNYKFRIEDIEGLSETLKTVERNSRPYLHGGGVPSLSAGSNITLTPKNDGGYTISSSGGGGIGSVLVATGAIDDSNLTFTFISKPTFLIVNGAVYQQTGGALTWTWTAGTLTATLSTQVGTGGSIFGI